MASVTVKVSGLRQLGEAMRGLAQDMNLRIARSATGKAASPIRKRARELAPVAPPEVTPQIPYASLRDNIVAKRVAPTETRFTSEHLVIVRGGKRYDYASHVAALQEFGTSKMQPHPFMRPAYDEQKENAVAEMKKAIKEGIDRASKA